MNEIYMKTEEVTKVMKVLYKSTKIQKTGNVSELETPGSRRLNVINGRERREIR